MPKALAYWVSDSKSTGFECKPADPPSIFGLPNSFTPQSSKTIAREIDKRGVSSETRQKTSERLIRRKIPSLVGMIS